MIRNIEGRNNQSVKLASKLQKKKYRRERGLFVTEGFDLLTAALEAGEQPMEVLIRDDLVERLPDELMEDAREDDLDVGVCSAEVLEKASGLGGASDVIALFEMVDHSLTDVRLPVGIALYLAGVGDPGNVGTIIRSAAAFGAGGVALAPGSADPYSPKALRAGMGAHFVIPVVPEVTADDLLAKMTADQERFGVSPTVVLADPEADEDLRGAELAQPVVLVFGEEREGLEGFGFPAGAGEIGIRRLAIRQAGFDSLNVAMAATVFLYEIAATAADR